MDYILWAVVAVAQVLVGFLGILSIKSDFAGQHFKTFVVAFAVLSIVGLIASGWGVVRATNASNQIAQLQQDTLYAIEGSPDSYAEIVPVFDETSGGNYEQGIVTFTLRNGAKHPMMDTDVWVTGVRHLDFSAFGVKIGDLFADRAKTTPKLKFQLRKDQECCVYFGIRSRSVLLWEEMRFQWNGTGWACDWNLYREVDGTQVYIRKFNPKFPFTKSDLPTELATDSEL